jgi:hypothetical protein
MKAYTARPLVILLLLCQLLASCRSYKSLGERADPAPSALASKVTPGKVYKVILITGEAKRMQILRVDEKNLYGTLYAENPGGKTLEAPNTSLPLDQVADLQEKRFNPLLTAALVVVPIALVVILVSQMDFNFNPFPNGI